MKILEIAGKLNIGGAQAVAANISKYADEDMHFTYLVFGDDVGALEENILKKGHKILHCAYPSEGMAKFFIYLVRLMKSERFDAVHCHTMYNCGVVMLAAKVAGVPGRLSHSHTINDAAGHSLGRRLYRLLMRALMCLFGTEFLACGYDAGCELYGKRKFEKDGIVIKNGIDIASYRFSEENRKHIREEYGIGDKYVIGHVGHYVKVKNQSFLIELMPEILKKRPNALLLMFGDGEDREMLGRLIEEKKLGESARLMGNVGNINEVLSAFDVFAFPSLFEGTPLALIEAQANGVPCIISNLIPDDACLTDAITKLPLEDKTLWVEALTEAIRRSDGQYAEQLLANYEDIRKSMQKLYGIFRKYDGKSGN